MIFLSERFSFRSSSTDLLDAHEIKKFDMKSRKKSMLSSLSYRYINNSLLVIGDKSIEVFEWECALLPVTVELLSVLLILC